MDIEAEDKHQRIARSAALVRLLIGNDKPWTVWGYYICQIQKAPIL